VDSVMHSLMLMLLGNSGLQATLLLPPAKANPVPLKAKAKTKAAQSHPAPPVPKAPNSSQALANPIQTAPKAAALSKPVNAPVPSLLKKLLVEMADVVLGMRSLMRMLLGSLGSRVILLLLKWPRDGRIHAT